MPTEQETRERIKEARKDERWKVNIEWETWLNKRARVKIFSALGALLLIAGYSLFPKIVELITG